MELRVAHSGETEDPVKGLTLSQRQTGEAATMAGLSRAKACISRKLRRLDLRPGYISEYNQRYLQSKIENLDSTLKTYAQLLKLCLTGTGIPLARFVLVDYGGGSGVLSFLAKELGIGTVICNDIYDVSCRDVTRLSDALDLPLDHVVEGDVGDLVNHVQVKSLDVHAVVSYDVMEHIYDVESHFRELALLSPRRSFRVIYASGANIENPWYVHAVTRKQREAENRNRKAEPGHKERDSLRSYHDIRGEIIRAHAPRLRADEIERLAKATRGLIKADIERTVDEYLTTGRVTYKIDHPTNTCDPYTGNWCEHLMNISWLTRTVRRAGFSVAIIPGRYLLAGRWDRRLAKLAANAVIQVFGRAALPVAPYYVVRAKRI